MWCLCFASAVGQLWIGFVGQHLYNTWETIWGNPQRQLRRQSSNAVRQKNREIFLSYQKSCTDVDKQRQWSEAPLQKVSQRSFTNHRNQRVVNFSPPKGQYLCHFLHRQLKTSPKAQKSSRKSGIVITVLKLFEWVLTSKIQEEKQNVLYLNHFNVPKINLQLLRHAKSLFTYFPVLNFC